MDLNAQEKTAMGELALPSRGIVRTLMVGCCSNRF